MMREKLTLLAVLVLALAPSGFAQYDGVVSIGSAQVPAGESFSVPIEISNNDVDISILSLPVQFSSSALTLDSVSAVGAIWTSQFDFVATIDNVERTARISVQPNTYTSPLPTVVVTDGLLARLHFTVDPAASPQFVEVDSILTEIDLGFGTVKKEVVQLADNSGGSVYYPDIVPGEIEVLVPTDVEDDPGGGLPTSYSLAQNYPNPFNPVTTIKYTIKERAHVSLKVYNVAGQLVRTLVDEVQSPEAVKPVEWRGRNNRGQKVASGVYFYKLVTKDFTRTRKMVLLK